jgi:hypothetical protein
MMVRMVPHAWETALPESEAFWYLGTRVGTASDILRLTALEQFFSFGICEDEIFARRLCEVAIDAVHNSSREFRGLQEFGASITQHFSVIPTIRLLRIGFIALQSTVVHEEIYLSQRELEVACLLPSVFYSKFAARRVTAAFTMELKSTL